MSRSTGHDRDWQPLTKLAHVWDQERKKETEAKRQAKDEIRYPGPVDFFLIGSFCQLLVVLLT